MTSFFQLITTRDFFDESQNFYFKKSSGVNLLSANVGHADLANDADVPCSGCSASCSQNH